MIESWMFLQDRSDESRDALRRALAYQSARLFRQIETERFLVTTAAIAYGIGMASELLLRMPQLKGPGRAITFLLQGETVLLAMGTLLFVLGAILFLQRLKQFKLELSLLGLQLWETKEAQAEQNDSESEASESWPSNRGMRKPREINLGDDE
jgi:hypothetical protein